VHRDPRQDGEECRAAPFALHRSPVNRSSLASMEPGQERSFHPAHSIGTLGLVPTPTPSSCNRFVVCARGDCRRQFSVCGRCDGGRRYCGPECARAARRLGLIRAGRAYQAKARGRELHAARQARYLDRRRAVTHRRLPEPLLLPPSGNSSIGTSTSPADALDTTNAATDAAPDLSNSKASTACVSCGRRSSFVRLYFLGECRSSRTAPRRKGPPTAASPSGRPNANACAVIPPEALPGVPVRFCAAALANPATPRLTWRHRRTTVVPGPLHPNDAGRSPVALRTFDLHVHGSCTSLHR
jgi:hypothetical protein